MSVVSANRQTVKRAIWSMVNARTSDRPILSTLTAQIHRSRTTKMRWILNGRLALGGSVYCQLLLANI